MFTINDPGRIGYLSQGIGTGLASALEGLAQHKTSEVQKKHTEKFLVDSGMPQGQAQSLVNSTPGAQQAFFKEHFKQQKGGQRPASVENYIKKYGEDLDTKADLEEKLLNRYGEIEDILGRGKVSSGLLGDLPGRSLFGENAALDTATSNLISELEQYNRIKGKGANRGGAYSQQLLEKGKINPKIPAQKQLGIIKREKSHLIPVYSAERQAFKEINDEFQGNIPENWKYLVEKRKNEILKEWKSSQSTTGKDKSLPEAKNFPLGKKLSKEGKTIIRVSFEESPTGWKELGNGK